jgi:3-deoxy-D-manno-octulosonic-acid transferase
LVIISDVVLSILTLFSSKIKRLKQGRKNTLLKLQKLPPKKNKRIWIHSASLGEFEMCLPLVHELNKTIPNIEWIFTFFSPSGYENAKIPENGQKFYMLSDTKKNANRWIHSIKPDLIIVVKYEFWLNHLIAGFESKIPTIYWNFLLRENHFLTKKWSQLWRNVLKQVSVFYAQDNLTMKLAQGIDFNAILLGDIRYTRAKELQNLQDFPIPKELLAFCHEKEILILGSSWQQEEMALSIYLRQNKIQGNQKIIIAPHDIRESHIQEIENQFSEYGVARFSNNNIAQANILILDGIGLLSRLYKLANVAVIGGGLGKGLHNCIEPLASGIPIIFGTLTLKSPEIQEFMDKGIGFGGKTSKEIAENIKLVLQKSPQEFSEIQNKIAMHINSSTPNIAKAADDIGALI